MKFSKPDPKVMQAFKMLGNNAHFIEILNWLDDCKRYSDNEHRDVPEDYKLHRNNGGAKVVNELLRLFHEARKL